MSSQPSAACCSLPAAKAGPYEAQGKIEKKYGYDVYVTGQPSATVGVFVIYDIFGLHSHTLQGADILSRAAPNPLVVIPDFFEGKPMKVENFPPQTDEQKAEIGAFFKGPANPEETVEKVKKAFAEARSEYSQIKTWVLIGYCWGGKITALVTGAGLEGLTASVQVHPAFMDAADADKIKIPHFVFASKDEDAEVVAKYKETLEKAGIKGGVVTYGDMHHGWMAARAKLEEDEFLQQYRKGYKQLADFIASVAQ